MASVKVCMIFVVAGVFTTLIDGQPYECDCRQNNGTCTSGGIALSGRYNLDKLCDGFNDCGDWSDEKNCTFVCIKNNQVPCDCHLTGTCNRDGKSYYWPCYSSNERCNDYNDCGDWSDEKNCNYTCSSGQVACDCFTSNSTCNAVGVTNERRPTCFNNESRCNGNAYCSDFSDEKECVCKESSVKCGCILDTVNCTSKLGCISRNDILNGVKNCADFSDEICTIKPFVTNRLISTSTNVTTSLGILHQCKDIESYQHYIALIGKAGKRQDCKQIEIFSGVSFDRIESQWWCTDLKYWDSGIKQCENGDFISAEEFCNGYKDCSDNSDEMIGVPGFKCRAKIEYDQQKQSCVLSQTNLYNNNSYCEDGTDVCFVDGKRTCFRCLDGRLMLSAKQICDGVIDCYDSSDECLCRNQTICNDVLGRSRDVCQQHEMLCNGECVLSSNVICNKSVNCNQGSNNRYCGNLDKSSKNVYETMFCTIDQEDKVYTRAKVCDGIPECYNRQDECGAGCMNETHFCNVPINCHHSIMNTEHATYTPSYCDGRPEMVNGSWDACGFGFDELNCTKRFYCNNASANVISVSNRFVCDGVFGCEDGSDEARIMCQDSRFFCRNGQPVSVASSLVENGFQDCSDASDECPVITQKSTVFSSRHEMIEDPIFRGLFWAMGIISLIGNVGAFISIAIRQSRESLSPLQVSLNCFLLNLSVSDFLMSVYLIVISIKGVEYSGGYCSHDAIWRTSGSCSFLGALTVVSFEVTSLLLAMMATFRLISVYKPFKMSNIKWPAYVIPTLFAWTVGILLGTIPLINVDYFVSSIWFPNYFYSRDIISKSEFELLFSRISKFTNSSPITNDLTKKKNFVIQTFPDLEIKGEIGFFGKTSVCIPELYVKIGDTSWEYSTFLIVSNLCLFLYLVICYIAIFRKSIQRKRNDQRSMELQKTIIILIMTNFFCWIPVCIMSFLSLGGIEIGRVVYIVSAGFLLPINSVINPFIYARVGTLLRKITAKIRMKRRERSSKPQQDIQASNTTSTQMSK